MSSCSRVARNAVLCHCAEPPSSCGFQGSQTDRECRLSGSGRGRGDLTKILLTAMTYVCPRLLHLFASVGVFAGKPVM